jgi:hypothetical protein
MNSPVKIAASRHDDLKRADAAAASAAVRVENAKAKVAQLQGRYDNPEPSDTLEILAKIKTEIDAARNALHLDNKNHERAVATVSAIKAELAISEDSRRRAGLAHRLSEAVRTAPDFYKRHANELLALVSGLHQLYVEIAAYNKARPAGVEFIPTFEQSVRWTEKSPVHSAIRPAPLSAVFEIPALQNGDKDYRVPGTFRPGDIWIDVNGHPRR